MFCWHIQLCIAIGSLSLEVNRALLYRIYVYDYIATCYIFIFRNMLSKPRSSSSFFCSSAVFVGRNSRKLIRTLYLQAPFVHRSVLAATTLGLLFLSLLSSILVLHSIFPHFDNHIYLGIFFPHLFWNVVLLSVFPFFSFAEICHKVCFQHHLKLDNFISGAALARRSQRWFYFSASLVK